MARQSWHRRTVKRCTASAFCGKGQWTTRNLLPVTTQCPRFSMHSTAPRTGAEMAFAIIPFILLAQRDTHAAHVIEKHILEPGKKAIVIYGGLHLYNNFGLRKLVEGKYPNAFFVVALYTGYAAKSCTANFEQNI